MKPVRIESLNHFLLSKQHLADRTRDGCVVDITKDIGGLHATDSMCAYFSLLARKEGFRREDLDRELYEKKTLGKVRYARKTVYILPKERISMAFKALEGALGERFSKYLEHLGMKESEFAALEEAILAGLGSGGMTAKEIRSKLAIKDNLHPVINLMCDRGLLIRGRSPYGWRSTQHSYHRMDLYFPDVDLRSWEGPDAEREIIRDYISAFGPVSERDIVWWTGFKRSRVRPALDSIRENLETVEIEDRDSRFFLISSQVPRLDSAGLPKGDVVNFLPLLDPYMMGYKERFRLLEDRFAPYVYDRTGNATYTILINGRVAGTWDFGRKDIQEMKIHLFDGPSAGLDRHLVDEAGRTGRFLFQKDVPVKFCPSMVPLTDRTMGGFMTPLRDS